MMPDLQISAVANVQLAWGESACWDELQRRLYFVDCVSRQLIWFDPATEAIVHMSLPSLPTALYLNSTSNRILVQLDDGIGTVAPDGRQLVIDHPPGELRFNDGICDSAGAIITGTLLFGVADKDAQSGSYWRWCMDIGWQKIHQGQGNTNGPCFSPDGKLLYVADSTAGLIHRFDYSTRGGLDGQIIFADTRPLGGVPDGATVDAEGYLWTTVCGGARLARYAPSGSLDRVVELPSSHPTSITFGGEGLHTAYITTIGTNILGIQPTGAMSGALLRVEGLGVQGLPRSRCHLRS